MFSTPEAAMNHIVLEGIMSMTGQPIDLSSSSPPKIEDVTANGEDIVANGFGFEKLTKGNKKDSIKKQKPLEGWIQDITTSAGDGSGDVDSVMGGSFEYSNGDLTPVENFDFVYRQLGFKEIKIVNFEADGHVVVQVMESSYSLYEKTNYVYDESTPAAELRPHRYYITKVDTKDGVYANRAEYRGQSRKEGHVLMYFTDVGQTVSVPKEHVYEIENYADAAGLPAQAVKVSVAGLTNMGYTVEELFNSLEEWVASDETYRMMRVKPLKGEKYIERSTGVPKVLIVNREGRALGVWRPPEKS